MRRLSEISSRIDGQPMFDLLEKVKKLEKDGKKIIHFEIGDPDFNTPENISNAAIQAIKNNYTHYTSSFGLPEFREVIGTHIEKTRGFKPDLNQILITPGANIQIFYAIFCLVNPKEEILVPNPGFPTYYSTIKMCGVTPVDIPLLESNNFQMNPNDIEKRITEKTRMIIINSPQNPTGSIIHPNDIKKIYDIAEKYDLFIYSDEIYSQMIYDNSSFLSPSVFDQCKKRTILSDGVSKTYAMTGWRLGSVVGPSKIIDKMRLLLETTSSCVSPFVQKAGIEAIIGEQTARKSMIDEYHKRRDLLINGLNSINGIHCISSEGSFYVFVNIMKTKMSSSDFCDYLLEDCGVAVLPGTSFGKYGEGYVRFCYAISQNDILKSIELIKNSLKKLNIEL